MANKHENLNSLFTNIADAIREKTGGSAKIIADDFPEEIRAISTSENLDAEIQEQKEKIAQLTAALEGKAGASGGADIETCTVSFDGGRGCTTRTICTRLINGVITTTTEFYYTEIFTDIVRGTMFCAIDEGDDCIPVSVSGDAEIVYDIYDYGIKIGSIIAINGNCTIHLEKADIADPI